MGVGQIMTVLITLHAETDFVLIHVLKMILVLHRLLALSLNIKQFVHVQMVMLEHLKLVAAYVSVCNVKQPGEIVFYFPSQC